ncbi:hypothetical protein CY34DRAFT_643058 [Suillus luteus UH-Slu-Lm8-n1]|uniref:Uncharacterized protein n=1 Tax=Suillus luteus UH-Slu-Lm8-n1 TaxID=930992 RepID=A0A0C9ZYC5_9AGAM|nr:hypothetical protein CY34DRAFT_643058 [Suillus luteus UH-Slu-Lm8-n1]
MDKLQSITPLSAQDFVFHDTAHLMRATHLFIVKMVLGIQERLLAWTPEQGSRQLVFTAVYGRNSGEDVKGGFVSHGCLVEVADFVLSDEGQVSKSTDSPFVHDFCFRHSEWYSNQIAPTSSHPPTSSPSTGVGPTF